MNQSIVVLLFFLLSQRIKSTSFHPSQRHLFHMQPVVLPEKFTGNAENTRTARRVNYYAKNLEDVFASSDEDSIGYGGILGKGYVKDIDVDTIECVSTAEIALQLVRVSVRELRSIMFCRKHTLRVTNDHGKTGMVLPVEIKPSSSNQPRKRMSVEVVEGVNYFIRLELLSGIVHEMTLNYDREGHYNMYHHTVINSTTTTTTTTTSTTTTTTTTVEVDSNGKTTNSDKNVQSELPMSSQLKILTLNVWNTNPPGWSAGSNRQDRYRKRIKLLASTINESMAEIVGLQEVRYDSSVGAPGDHFQMKHLLDELGQGWYFTYNPSMNYFDAQRYSSNGREEEGAAILSRYPIVETDYILLPRFWDDEEDNQHQRQCLRARVKVGSEWGMVDIFTTHLSLSERARDASVQEMYKYVQLNEVGATLQILLGDLNAEPDTKAIQYLQGMVPMEEGETKTNFQDAWLASGHNEPESHSKDEQVRLNELTFPSDEPKKRIDLILFRDGGRISTNGSDFNDHTKMVEVIDTRLVGQHALQSTRNDPGHGMLDPDSPLWASDHRGVVSSFIKN